MKKLIVLFMLILVSFFYCTLDIPDDPKAPKWDIEIEKIPFLKADTLTIRDRLNPDDFKRKGADSLVSIDISDEKYFDLADKFKIPPQNTSFSDRLGEIEIDINQSVNVEISFTDIYPEFSYLLGTEAVIPETEIEPVDKSIELEEFSSVSVVSGGVTMEVTNNMGFVMDGDMKMDLIDVGKNNQLIETIILERIENNESATHYVNLAGKIISNRLKAILYGTLNGSDGQVVYIPINAGINLTVTPEKIVVNEATAKLPEQSFDLSGSVDINLDSLRIRQAKIESGSIIIKIDNDFDFNVDLNISIPNVLDSNNDELKKMLSITAHNTKHASIPFNNSTIDLDNKDLVFSVLVTIFPDTSRMYTIKSSDELSVEVNISEILLESVTADFDLTEQFPEIREDVFKDMPEELDNFGFHEIIVTLGFLNCPFDLDLDIVITGVRNNVTKQLPIKKTVEKNSSLILSRNGVNNDLSSPTIVDLINMLPEEILISGSVGVKGENVTFKKNDQIGVKYGIDFPLIFSTAGASFSHYDSLIIEGGMRDFLKDNSMSAEMILTVENAFPISGMLSLSVGQDSTNISSKLLTIGLPKPVLKNNVVNTPGVATFTIALDKPQFTAIADAIFYQFDVSIDDIQEAGITANDFIIIKDVFLSGSFLFDPNGISEDENGNN